MAITFLHTGDEHLDAETHGAVNPATGRNSTWESNLAVIHHMVDTAVERGVDFYLSCGDNFKNGRPSMEALMLFAEAHRPLARAGIPIILLGGNHHTIGVAHQHRTLIHPVAEILRAAGGKVHTVDQPKLLTLEPGVQVAGLPWLSKATVLTELGTPGLPPAEGDQAVTAHAMSLLERMAETASSSAPLIMASHVTVDKFRLDSLTAGYTRGSEVELAHLFSEPVLPTAQLEQLPFHYGALSHIHAPQQVSDRYHYAGSPNRLTFTDMPDSKGANLVTLDGNGGHQVERIATPARTMARLDLETDQSATVIDQLAPGTLVQVVLETGQTEIPRPLRAAIYRAGAVIASTKTRPAPPPVIDVPTLSENIDPSAALKAWAAAHAPTVNIDDLLTTAEQLEA